MTIPTTTNVDAIGAALDELAHALSDVPGRTPQDVQTACVLLSATVACVRSGQMSPFLLDTLRGYGADIGEAQTVARSLASLSLRLAAYLGRTAR